MPQPWLYTNILVYLPARPAPAPGGRAKYSVVMLLVDSLSQLNLVRSLPETLQAVEAQGGVLLRGHHKVGHNSWPNVMALLGGEERPPWPLDRPRPDCYYVDEEHRPLLLHEFGRHGWTTLYLEDFQLYGNFAREGRLGFRRPPAHHYYRAAYWAVTRERWLGGGLRNQLVGKADNFACQQELPAHAQPLRILQDLATGRQGPFFAFVHLNEYTHNSLGMAAQYDRPVKELVTTLGRQGALNNTFFLLLGDHGFQRGDHPFVLTELGRIENNMPALLVLPPASLATDRPEMVAALRQNAESLTSHQDVYATLREVLALGSEQEPEPRGPLAGRSLLHPLPPRTCAEAGVPAEHCSCTGGRALVEPRAVEAVARALLQDTEAFLPAGLCSRLELGAVLEAAVRGEGGGQEGRAVLEILMEVLPGQAKFQVQPLPFHPFSLPTGGRLPGAGRPAAAAGSPADQARLVTSHPILPSLPPGTRPPRAACRPPAPTSAPTASAERVCDTN
jgi:hypothetical protein